MIYEKSIDMIRLMHKLDYEEFEKLINVYMPMYNVKKEKEWIGKRAREYRYNYNYRDVEGNGFYIGYEHNSERINNHRKNIVMEYNPNKLKDNYAVKKVLERVYKNKDYRIKSLDIAYDMKVNICNLIVDKDRKRYFMTLDTGEENITYYIGKGSGRIKIYNKGKQMGSTERDWTRFEMSVETDAKISEIETKINNMKFTVPNVYSTVGQESIYDINDKTLKAVLYAVANGYSINQLSRVMKEKVEKSIKKDKIGISEKVIKEDAKELIKKYIKEVEELEV